MHIHLQCFLTTDPEEFAALLDHVCQAVSGSQVLIQVPLVWLSQCLLPVHHPLTKEEDDKISNSINHRDSEHKRGQRKHQGVYT